MAEGFLPPVVVEILASIRDFQAKKGEVIAGMEEIKAAGDSTSSRLSTLGSRVTKYAAVAAVGVAAYATKLAMDYSESLDKMARTTTLTDEQVKKLIPTMLNVSRTTATSATDITDAYTQAIKGGLSLAEAHKAVTSAAKFAKAENGNLKDSMAAALIINKMHIAGTKSVTNTMDIFTNAIKNSKLTANDLTSAFSGRAAATFAAYHVDLKTASTLMAGFANQGMNGSRAMMAMTALFTKMNAPATTATGKITAAAAALQSVGLNQTTLASQMKRPGGVLTVLQEINTAFNRNASATQKAAGMTSFLGQIFSPRAGMMYSNIITQLPELQKLYTKLPATGTTSSQFSEWLKSPKGAMEKFVATAQAALIPLGDWILPKMTRVVEWGTKVMNYFEAHPLIAQIAGDAAIGLFAGKLAMAVGKGIANTISTIKAAFTGTAMTANTTATDLNTDALIALTDAIPLIGTGGTLANQASNAAVDAAKNVVENAAGNAFGNKAEAVLTGGALAGTVATMAAALAAPFVMSWAVGTSGAGSKLGRAELTAKYGVDKAKKIEAFLKEHGYMGKDVSPLMQATVDKTGFITLPRGMGLRTGVRNPLQEELNRIINSPANTVPSSRQKTNVTVNVRAN